MSNPTNPFSWQMPTPTDLVTDLQADFEVFGQAVATSLADLLGGTSGQILAKNSNTDMDFVWIANDQGDITGITASSPLTGGGTSGAVTVGIQDATTAQKGAVQLENSTSSTSTTTAAVPASVKSAYDLADGAIAKSTVTTAGDLIYRNSTVPTRLGIGTAGQVLQVNSGATAPEWATPSSGGGMTLLSTTTLSGGTTVTISSISGSYKNLFVLVKNAYLASADNEIRFILNSDSGSNYAQGSTGSVSSNNYGTKTTKFVVAGYTFNSNAALDKTTTAAINFYRYTDTNCVMVDSTAFAWQNGTPRYFTQMNQGVYVGSAAITSIEFSSDVNFSGGTVYVYGVS